MILSEYRDTCKEGWSESAGTNTEGRVERRTMDDERRKEMKGTMEDLQWG